MNYFNSLPLRLQLEQLSKCRFMDKSEFSNGVNKLKGKKVVILGCGAQGLNQGLNMRDSGLDISYALRVFAKPAYVMSPDAKERLTTIASYKSIAPPPEPIRPVQFSKGIVTDGLVIPRGEKPVSLPEDMLLPPTASKVATSTQP